MDDYSGAFDREARLELLSRCALAGLGREYMLFGHLLNRAALPHVHLQLGAPAREAVAVEEWMGASPIYTRRMQRAMRFAGGDVPAIFKGLQIDVGFAHQYMDVRYELESAQRGFFWLASCGALLEVEPYGEEAVVSMCHHIEDPTFDATAVATNPRARCRPIHRPPRRPAGRVPHCRWEVYIDPDAEPLQEIALTQRVRASRLAGFEFAPPADDGTGGRADYSGAFDPDFHLEVLSHAALLRVCGPRSASRATAPRRSSRSCSSTPRSSPGTRASASRCCRRSAAVSGLKTVTRCAKATRTAGSRCSMRHRIRRSTRWCRR